MKITGSQRADARIVETEDGEKFLYLEPDNGKLIRKPHRWFRRELGKKGVRWIQCPHDVEVTLDRAYRQYYEDRKRQREAKDKMVYLEFEASTDELTAALKEAFND